MAAGTGASSDVPCVFTLRNYAVGDVWYPRLGQRGALHCVACICQEVRLFFISIFDRFYLRFLKNDILKKRAGKSTAPFTSVADKNALHLKRPLPTSVASTVPVSPARMIWLVLLFDVFLLICFFLVEEKQKKFPFIYRFVSIENWSLEGIFSVVCWVVGLSVFKDWLASGRASSKKAIDR